MLTCYCLINTQFITYFSHLPFITAILLFFAFGDGHCKMFMPFEIKS